MDIATPRNVKLSAFFQRSNAVINAKERIPCCLKAIIYELKNKLPDILSHYGEEAHLEMLSIITQIENLKTEVDEDTPFRKLYSKAPDVQFYNDYLDKMTVEDCRPTMLQTVRMYAECYVYRRVWECFELARRLTFYDPYDHMKSEHLTDCLVLLKKMGKLFKSLLEYPVDDKPLVFDMLLRLNLWSNKRHNRRRVEYIKDRLAHIRNLNMDNENIICNDSERTWDLFREDVSVMDSNLIVDFILDSTGYELFQDLLLAHFLVVSTSILKIRFHVKHIPFFIWGTTEKDIYQLLNKMKQISKIYVQNLATHWTKFIEQEKWQIVVRQFWCLPHSFSDMKTVDPWLYQTLNESKLIIMKGDMNFQKTVGDFNWNPETAFRTCLAQFHPSNILFIRIVKSDLVCGLSSERARKVERVHEHLSEGYFGMIQFASRSHESIQLLD